MRGIGWRKLRHKRGTAVSGFASAGSGVNTASDLLLVKRLNVRLSAGYDMSGKAAGGHS